MFTLLVTIIVSFCGICFVGIGLIFYSPESTACHYPLLMKLYPTTPENVIILLGYISFVFFLNIPLFELLERRARRMTRVQAYDQNIFPYMIDRTTVFGKLRRRCGGNQLQPPRILMADVLSDSVMQVRTELFFKFRLKAFPMRSCNVSAC